jgi:two-component system, cell cycle response regulator
MVQMKVLIIDDDQDSLAVAGIRLKKDGYSICTALDGHSGLIAAMDQQPDLILLDVQMPGMDGFDVIKRLKSDARLQGIPVIFLSAENDTREKVRGLDLGAVDYVTKPFDVFELRARVRAALRTKRLQDLLLLYGEVDSLTEVYNRRVLMERLQQEWDRSRRYGTVLSLVMADIDRFKTVNDTWGHPAGDRVLSGVAGTLKSMARSGDIVGRYGGEEFALVMVRADAKSACSAAERCRLKIEGLRFRAGDGLIGVTVSFGVADSTGKKSLNHMIDASDRALYMAKETGRNRVCVDA